MLAEPSSASGKYDDPHRWDQYIAMLMAAPLDAEWDGRCDDIRAMPKSVRESLLGHIRARWESYWPLFAPFASDEFAASHDFASSVASDRERLPGGKVRGVVVSWAYKKPFGFIRPADPIVHPAA